MLSPDVTVPALSSAAILRRLARDYLRGQWGRLMLALACMAITAVTTAALAYIIGPAIRGIFLDKQPSMLTLVPLAALAILVVRAASYFFQATLIETLGERVVAACQKDMFKSIVRQDLASLNATHSGNTVSKFLYDTAQMRDAITKGMAGMGIELVSLIGLAAIMVWQDWQLAILSVVALPFVAWIMERIGKSLRRASTRSMAETGSLATVLSETLDGRRIVKAYGLENHVVRAAASQIDTRLRFLLKAVRRRAAAIPVTDIVAGLVVAATLYYAGHQVVSGQLTLDRFASFIAAMLLAQQPVRNLSQLSAITSTGIAAASRVFEIIDARATITDAPGAAPLLVKGGAVTFKNVTFSYGEEGRAIHDVSLAVNPGEKIALVGASGGGKTTLFNLLLRFFDPQQGTIEIDEQDIRHTSLSSLRMSIALVTQEQFLFDETVYENIALGRNGATRTDIEGAARNAFAHEFIETLPAGYETKLGEGGLRLSGGQKQRIAIARAMVRNAPILLLDEATSALDTESERKVQEALDHLMAGKTTIIIAHRLSTIKNADRIYVIDAGRIVESGTHETLIKANGPYARLYGHDALGQ